MSITRTAFNKLNGAKLAASFPVDVTVSGKLAFTVVAPGTPVSHTTPSRDGLINLVLKARNQDRGDSQHVKDAEAVVDAFLAVSTPTNPSGTGQTSGSVGNGTSTATIDMTNPNWLGEWSGNVKDYVSNQIKELKATTTILLVPYNIPGRDNGNYSSGGLHTAEEYHQWVSDIAAGIGSSKAEVVIEPDAIGLSVSLNETQRQARYTMLNDAIAVFKKNPNTKAYIDSSMWLGVDKSVEMLGPIRGADGFSCNVSGYQAQDDCIAYVTGIYKKSGMHGVIDTSRNGKGAPHGNMWCNQTDTMVGVKPTYNTGIEGIDAFLWIKVPGESDGLGINDDGSHPRTDVPSAGTMWPELRDALYSGDWTSFKAKYHV